jgi:hypothetical protein
MLPGTRYKPKPCPRSLLRLLQGKADPNFIEMRVDSPVLHIAAYSSTPKEVRILLDFRANIEIGEHGAPTPPLNSALAAGNAPVALQLLELRANCQWKHEDGATALHVAGSWIADPDRARSRRPPLGDEPVSVIKGLFHNGVDPLQREGMAGLTALDCFRDAMKSSPWLKDEEIGPEFIQTSQRIMAIMLAADEAMKLKAKGADTFGKKKYKETLEHWLAARKKLEKGDISGHHRAVLCSNLAICYKNLGDMVKCRASCEEGLSHYAAGNIHTKLNHHLAECDKAIQAAGYAAPEVPISEQAVPPDVDGGPVEAASLEETQDNPEKKKDAWKGKALKQGFLSDIKDGDEMYGPEGSKQGKNHSELVKVTLGVGGPNGPPKEVMVPFGKVMPQVYDPRAGKDEDSD